MTPAPPNRLIREPDAARILGVAGSTLRRLRSHGKGPPYICVSGQPGGAIRYRIADIDTWLARNTVTPNAGGANGRA